MEHSAADRRCGGGIDLGTSKGEINGGPKSVEVVFYVYTGYCPCSTAVVLTTLQVPAYHSTSLNKVNLWRDTRRDTLSLNRSYKARQSSLASVV